MPSVLTLFACGTCGKAMSTYSLSHTAYIRCTNRQCAAYGIPFPTPGNKEE